MMITYSFNNELWMSLKSYSRRDCHGCIDQKNACSVVRVSVCAESKLFSFGLHTHSSGPSPAVAISTASFLYMKHNGWLFLCTLRTQIHWKSITYCKDHSPNGWFTHNSKPVLGKVPLLTTQCPHRMPKHRLLWYNFIKFTKKNSINFVTDSILYLLFYTLLTAWITKRMWLVSFMV